MTHMQVRPAIPEDTSEITQIYNQGILERTATFETHPRSADEVSAWFDGVHPIVVVEIADKVIAFSASFPYQPRRECYAGVGEFSVYVVREARGRGAGRLAMAALLRASKEAGFWKLVSRVFPENIASRKLLHSLGFREVGIYEKHARLDGVWRDVIIVERLISPNLTELT